MICHKTEREKNCVLVVRPVVQLHVSALCPGLDGVQHDVWWYESGGSDHLEQVLGRHQRQTNCCQYLLGHRSAH